MERYLKRVGAAIEFIEANLGEPIVFADVAAASGYSPWHFHRIFSGMVGETATEYLRRRRLTIAADALLGSDARLVDLAFDAGFDSQEAFTRAFQREFGMPPGRFRREGRLTPVRRRDRIDPETLRHLAGGITMEPRLVEREEFHVVGMAGRFTPETTTGIKDLWGRFVPRMGEIEGVAGPECYGVCCEAAGTDGGEASFEYVCAMPVNDPSDPPEGMVGRTVPGGTYAVFTHSGSIERIGATMDYIWGTWLPKSGYEATGTPDFEFYDERFDGETGEGEVDVYVPVAKPE